MARLPWLDEVKRRLVESGLPSVYIRRFTEELADHFQDLMEENMNDERSVLSRLGEPGQVSDSAVAAYQQRTFLGRHLSARLLVFGVSPALAMVAAFWLACVGMAAVAVACRHFGLWSAIAGDVNEMGRVETGGLLYFMSAVTIILPALGLAIFYGRFARTLVTGRKWVIVSCAALALAAMLPFHSVALSSVPGQSLWTIGLQLPPSALQCVQLCVPLLVGLWLMRSSRKPAINKNEPLQMAA